jgi:hypothetical protein
VRDFSGSTPFPATMAPRLPTPARRVAALALTAIALGGLSVVIDAATSEPPAPATSQAVR